MVEFLFTEDRTSMDSEEHSQKKIFWIVLCQYQQYVK